MNKQRFVENIISQINIFLNEWKRTVFFWLFFFLFLHFRFPRCHSFFYSIPIKKILSLLLILLNHLSLFIAFFLFVIIFFLLFSLCLILFWIIFFSQSSLQTFLLFIWNIVLLWYRSLFRFTSFLLILRFPFLKVIVIYLQHAAILIERFGQTCMTEEHLWSEMLMLYSSVRPLLHWAVRCTYRP